MTFQRDVAAAAVDVVDNLTSTDTDKALSANQGKTIKDEADTVRSSLGTLAAASNLGAFPQTVLPTNASAKTVLSRVEALLVNLHGIIGADIDDTTLDSGQTIEEAIAAILASDSASFATVANAAARLADSDNFQGRMVLQSDNGHIYLQHGALYSNPLHWTDLSENDFSPPADAAARLALPNLVGQVAQQQDTGDIWVQVADDASQAASWENISSPTKTPADTAARLALGDNPSQTVYQQDTGDLYFQVASPATTPGNWKNFSRNTRIETHTAHGLSVGARCYLDDSGVLTAGTAAAGDEIPRVVVISVPNVNVVELATIDGAWLDDATSWDITNGGLETNSRYAKTQDLGGLGHDSGAVDNIERYYWSDLGGGAHRWILFSGRSASAGTIPGTYTRKIFSTNNYTQQEGELDLWSNASGPAVLTLLPVAGFSAGDEVHVKNTGNDFLTVNTTAGADTIDGAGTQVLDLNVTLKIRKHFLPNRWAIIA